MPAESYLVTRYAKPKQRCHRKQADQRPIEEPITAGLFRFLEASTDERVSKTNERVDMTMMHGRVNKITKRGFLFLDACDGGLDVFVSDKIADRSGDKFAIGDRVEFDEKLSADGRRFAASIKLVERAPPPPPPKLIRRTGTVAYCFADRDFCFVRDELSGEQVFVGGRVMKASGVKLADGDVVTYAIEMEAPKEGRRPAAVP
jgi:cold shock CspA family protein